MPSDDRVKLTPDEVRHRIRRDHERISTRLQAVESCLDRVEKGDVARVPQLREALQDLGDVLLGHLHFEEYQWSTLVPRQGAEEHSALEVMKQEHQAQRELLDRVIGELNEVAIGSALVVGVKELAHAIRDDMEHEERELVRQTE
jgi:iron-sulfur cluster repair protein YtfE (RIC family)